MSQTKIDFHGIEDIYEKFKNKQAGLFMVYFTSEYIDELLEELKSNLKAIDIEIKYERLYNYIEQKPPVIIKRRVLIGYKINLIK